MLRETMAIASFGRDVSAETGAGGSSGGREKVVAVGKELGTRGRKKPHLKNESPFGKNTSQQSAPTTKRKWCNDQKNLGFSKKGSARLQKNWKKG